MFAKKKQECIWVRARALAQSVIEQRDIRNTSGMPLDVPCSGCDESASFILLVNDGRIHKLLPTVPHCEKCHQATHMACEQCGLCMPETGWGLGAAGEGQARKDKRFCSNACRQLAYRQRAEAARVPAWRKTAMQRGGAVATQSAESLADLLAAQIEARRIKELVEEQRALDRSWEEAERLRNGGGLGEVDVENESLSALDLLTALVAGQKKKSSP